MQARTCVNRARRSRRLCDSSYAAGRVGDGRGWIARDCGRRGPCKWRGQASRVGANASAVDATVAGRRLASAGSNGLKGGGFDSSWRAGHPKTKVSWGKKQRAKPARSTIPSRRSFRFEPFGPAKDYLMRSPSPADASVTKNHRFLNTHAASNALDSAPRPFLLNSRPRLPPCRLSPRVSWRGACCLAVAPAEPTSQNSTWIR